MVVRREAWEMRKLTLGIATLTLVVALAAPSVAQAPQTTLIVKAQVIPNKAGTPKKPQGVKIRASVTYVHPEGFERKVVDRGYVLFPRHGDYNGDDYPRCTKRLLDRKGPKACPKKSYMGYITGDVYADTVITHPQIRVFNGGAKLALAHVTLYHPTLVKETIPVRIQELPRGKWKYKVSLRVPESLQIVAGVPIAPKRLYGTVGRGTWITTTSCPKSRRWEYEGKAFFTDGTTVTHRDSVPCRPASGG
jgi:hypothetical protein